MITTQQNARRILAGHYSWLRIRLTVRTQIGVRPVYETSLGIPSLAWRKLDAGKDSSVRIGQLLPNGDIGWNWEAPV